MIIAKEIFEDIKLVGDVQLNNQQFFIKPKPWLEDEEPEEEEDEDEDEEPEEEEDEDEEPETEDEGFEDEGE